MMVTIGGTILKEIIQDASLSILLEGKRAIGYAIPLAKSMVNTTEILTAWKLVNKADLKLLSKKTSR